MSGKNMKKTFVSTAVAVKKKINSEAKNTYKTYIRLCRSLPFLLPQFFRLNLIPQFYCCVR